MKIPKDQVARLASEHEIRHSESCREANRKRYPFVCACDFFDRVHEAFLDEGGTDADLAASAEGAREEAQRLIDQGFYQRSRKYRRLVRPLDPEPGNFHIHDYWRGEGETIEVGQNVWDAFRQLGGGTWSPWKELARLQRVTPDKALYADLTYRVPLPPGADAAKLFDSVKVIWPEARLLQVCAVRDDLEWFEPFRDVLDHLDAIRARSESAGDPELVAAVDREIRAVKDLIRLHRVQSDF